METKANRPIQLVNCGVLGHEFIGVIEETDEKEQLPVGTRVVGEINLCCEYCDVCQKGGIAKRNHCPNRTVLVEGVNKLIMQTYMERRLIGLHDTGSTSNFKEKVITFVLGVFFIFFVPFVHFGVIYYIWAPDKQPVKRGKCTCECFDTIFRGRYEWPPSNYKHFYFNSTAISLKIWLVIILGVLLCYECIKYVAPLIWKKKCRASMVTLLLTSLYPHYYGWWGLIQYLNEEYWYQYYHQIFFSITEIISTAMVIHLCNKENNVQPWKLLIIFNINVIHIIIGGLDQFIENVLFGRGQLFEALRDFGLMLPDIFHVLVSYFEMKIFAENKGISFLRIFYREELMLSGLFIILFSLLGKNLY